MKKILKFQLFGQSEQLPSGAGEEVIPVTMPNEALILEVGVQFEIPQIWALVDPQAPREVRLFRIYGTGQPMPDNPGIYRGTFHLKGGSLVAHLFEA